MSDTKGIRNNYDAVFKDALTLYRNKTLEFLGLDLAMIEGPINTEMTEVNVKKNFTDMSFILKDKTGLHTEWEVDISIDDILRFFSYNINYTRMYKAKFTTVIFTNKAQPINHFENEMLKFTPIVINLSERDGDVLLQKIKAQIENKEPVNELELIYLPLYHSKYKNTAEMLEQIIELAPLVSGTKAENEKIMIMSAVLANKFINEEDYRKIWEAIRVYIDDLYIIKFAKKDAKEEGVAEGKAEGVAEVIMNMLNKGLDIDTIAEYTNVTADEVNDIKKNMQKVLVSH